MSDCVHKWEKLYRDWMRCATCGEFMQEAAPAATPASGPGGWGDRRDVVEEETRKWARPWDKQTTLSRPRFSSEDLDDLVERIRRA